MKLTEFKEHELRDDLPTTRLFPGTPHEHALRLVDRALEAVNRAGLDGKELSDLYLVRRYERGETTFEVHAKVRHRLREKS